MNQIILTGIKPTGTPHIGNYFGAIKPAINMSLKEDKECLFFIADYHALTTVKDAKLFKEYTYEIAATWLACGLDPQKVVFYKQSDVPEVFELNWILNNVTPKGLMNRAHAYKACVEKNLKEGLDSDVNINMGLYNYPILMAADIVIMNTNLVPVGLDQKQHVEMAKEIVRYFNKTYGNCLVSPKEMITENVQTLVGLDGRKMSKSYGNTITLFGDENTLNNQIKRIVTNSQLPGEKKDIDCTIFKIFSLFATDEEIENMKQLFNDGIGWGEVKKRTFEVANRVLAPMREIYNHYMNNRNEIDKILEKGAIEARKVAKETLLRVRRLIGN